MQSQQGAFAAPPSARAAHARHASTPRTLAHENKGSLPLFPFRKGYETPFFLSCYDPADCLFSIAWVPMHQESRCAHRVDRSAVGAAAPDRPQKQGGGAEAWLSPKEAVRPRRRDELLPSVNYTQYASTWRSSISSPTGMTVVRHRQDGRGRTPVHRAIHHIATENHKKKLASTRTWTAGLDLLGRTPLHRPLRPTHPPSPVSAPPHSVWPRYLGHRISFATCL